MYNSVAADSDALLNFSFPAVGSVADVSVLNV